MLEQTKVTGVILAGGLARRMNHQDKGLVRFNGKPMISHAITAMEGVCDAVIINANRHKADYEAFGLPVISDLTESFDGPLAGVLAALTYAKTDILVVMPCDSPYFRDVHLRKLLHMQADRDLDVVTAFDGEYIHPVFLTVKAVLRDSLQSYLASGQRKVEGWLRQHRHNHVDFSDEPDIFININTLAELARLGTKP